MSRERTFDCPDVDLIRASGGDFGLAGLSPFEKVGYQPKDPRATHIGGNAQVEMTISIVTQRSHVKAATHALSIHDGDHQGRLCISDIVIGDFYCRSFEIDKNCL